MSARAVVSILLLMGACIVGVYPAAAQENPVLMPEESAAKAKQLLQRAIEALGGAEYLNVRDITCNGHISQFDNHEALSGYIEVTDSRRLPDKAMIEYIVKGRHNILQYLTNIEGLDVSHGGIVITLYNGDHGWSYDHDGVSDLPADAVDAFQDQLKRNLGNLLRVRRQEPGMALRYAGRDVVDLREADWIEMEDADDHTIRIALDASTHLPIRTVSETHDAITNTNMTETVYYSDYHSVGGIQTAFQVTHERHGAKIQQEFFDKCDYNTGLSDSLFTRASLEERYAHAGNKSKSKSKEKN
jgi:hypothetical protein